MRSQNRLNRSTEEGHGAKYRQRSMNRDKKIQIFTFLSILWLSGASDYGLAYDNLHLIEDATAGDREAQYTLAHLYYKGLGGVDRSIPEAIAWFRRAAETGHVDSMYDLAMIILDDQNGIARKEESFYWLKKSADLGHGDAQYALGRAYGLSEPAKGVYWLRQAILNGHPEASEYLEKWCKSESIGCD